MIEGLGLSIFRRCRDVILCMSRKGKKNAKFEYDLVAIFFERIMPIKLSDCEDYGLCT